jgi:hypothetical protein
LACCWQWLSPFKLETENQAVTPHILNTWLQRLSQWNTAKHCTTGHSEITLNGSTWTGGIFSMIQVCLSLCSSLVMLALPDQVIQKSQSGAWKVVLGRYGILLAEASWSLACSVVIFKL